MMRAIQHRDVIRLRHVCEGSSTRFGSDRANDYFRRHVLSLFAN